MHQAPEPYPISADSPCDLGWALTTTLGRYQAYVEPILAGFPRGSRGYQLLYTVVHYRLESQNDLAAYLGIDRTVLTYVIEDLRKAGLVERQVLAQDRRVRIIHPTSLGKEKISQIQTELAKAEEIFFAGISTADAASFRYLLSNIAVAFRQEN